MRKISMAKTVFVLILMAAAAISAKAERTETIIYQTFDSSSLNKQTWETSNVIALEDDGMLTGSTPATVDTKKTFWPADKPKFSGLICKQDLELPTAEQDYFIRMEWALIPLELTTAGQDVTVENGPLTVQFNGNQPVLNEKYKADGVITPAEKVIISCDFNKHAVISWKINGEEKLAAPVPAIVQRDTILRLDRTRQLKADEPIPPDVIKRTKPRVRLGDWLNLTGRSKWLWIKVSKVYPDDVLKIRLSGWDDLPLGKEGQPAPFMLAQANSMTKVFREINEFKGSFEPHVKIAAAGREREHFQIVVIPTGKSLQGINVKVSDFIHADGKTKISAENVSWHPVGYIKAMPSRSYYQKEPDWLWPDVLLPTSAFDVEAGFVQPVWFTVKVPADQRQGRYRTIVTFQLDGKDTQYAGVELTVRNFNLPLRGKLKTAFSTHPHEWEMWYRPEQVKENEYENALPREKWLAFYDFMLERRLNPTTIYTKMHDGHIRTLPAMEDIDYCYERGLNAVCLGEAGQILPDDPNQAEEYLQQLKGYLEKWSKVIDEKGWTDVTWYVHGYDETDSRPDVTEKADESIKIVYGMIKKEFPDIKCESANPYNPEHLDYFDIWSSRVWQWTPDMFECQAKGGQSWLYVSSSAVKPYANFFLDYPGTDPRILLWQSYQSKADGFLYYLINLYRNQENYGTTGPKWPEQPWHSYSYEKNHDGILIYPGPDAMPLASTRLENVADGIEDYEALAILEDLTKQLQAKQDYPELTAKCRRVLAVRPSVCKSFKEYSSDPEIIAAARAEVDTLIEELISVTGEKP